MQLYHKENNMNKENKFYTYVLCKEFLSETPMLNVIYIIENHGILFTCPCGCNVEIFLKKNKWKYCIIEDNLSITPSIHVIYPCNSHFFITEGEVIWC